MNTTSSSAPHASTRRPDGPRGDRALVLGGGGSTGNAWLIGVVAGLFDAGLDVTTADLTVGTSAGSTAAAQLAGATPTELLRRRPRRPRPATAAPTEPTGPRSDPTGDRPPGADAPGSSPPRPTRPTCVAGWARPRSSGTLRRTAPGRRNGAPPSPRGCPARGWPRRPVLITAVDAAHRGPGRLRPAQRGRPGRRRRRQLFQRPAVPDRGRRVHRRRLPVQRRERRPRRRLRAGAGAVALRRPVAGTRRPGARTSPRRSTSCAHAAAGSRRSSRTATPSTCSGLARWTRRCVRRPRAPATRWAAPGRSGSASSGADRGPVTPDARPTGCGTGVGRAPDYPTVNVPVSVVVAADVPTSTV